MGYEDLRRTKIKENNVIDLHYCIGTGAVKLCGKQPFVNMTLKGLYPIATIWFYIFLKQKKQLLF